MRREVLVVGGGISGVACARALTGRRHAGAGAGALEPRRAAGWRAGRCPTGPTTSSTSAPPTSPRATRSSSPSSRTGSGAGSPSRGPTRSPPAARTARGRRRPGRSGGPRPAGCARWWPTSPRAVTVSTGHTVASVTPGPAVDGTAARAVVLAMPDPQAARLLDPALRAAAVVADRAWNPVISVALGYGHRGWERLPRRVRQRPPRRQPHRRRRRPPRRRRPGARRALHRGAGAPAPRRPRRRDRPGRRRGHRAARPGRRAGLDPRAPLDVREPRAAARGASSPSTTTSSGCAATAGAARRSRRPGARAPCSAGRSRPACRADRPLTSR